MKKALIFILTGVFVSVNVHGWPEPAQEYKESTARAMEYLTVEPDADAAAVSAGTSSRRGRIVLGGALGLSFGDYTSVTISPQVGYRLNSYFSFGGGFSYNYYNNKDWNYKLNYAGFNLYARVYPIPYITLFTQPEIQRRWGTVRGRDTGSDVFACLLLGGGVVIPAGYRTNMTISVYYDVLQNDYSPHGNNVGYSVGFTFGF